MAIETISTILEIAFNSSFLEKCLISLTWWLWGQQGWHRHWPAGNLRWKVLVSVNNYHGSPSLALTAALYVTMGHFSSNSFLLYSLSSNHELFLQSHYFPKVLQFWSVPTSKTKYWYMCARLRRWYITIPSSDQWWCTTIENHRYQWLSYPKPSENHWSQWLASTIPFNGELVMLWKPLKVCDGSKRLS